MATKKKAENTLEKDVRTYTHDDKTRLNNPYVGYAQHDLEEEPKKKYDYDPHIDPSLQWAGKAERTSFEIPTVSLHIHETINPFAVIKNVKKRGGRGTVQSTLFDTDSLKEREEVLEFYKHPRNWANRLIAGDSLLVMNSIIEKEGMARKVQMIYIDPPYGIKYGSNFQPFVSKKDVTDGKDEDLTQEPEMIKAFRDTWELGIHSYLSYLRDRILLCKELLTNSGSIFIQISGENIHHVREICDEILGDENFVAIISYTSTSGFESSSLSRTGDYVIWYSKSKKEMKYRPLYLLKEFGEEGSSTYTNIELKDGRRLSIAEWVKETGSDFDFNTKPAGSRIFAIGDLTSQGASSEQQPFEFDGKTYYPKTGNHWKANYPSGMEKLRNAGRIYSTGNRISYVRYLDDFSAIRMTNMWKDTSSSFMTKRYVVETNPVIIQRCMLMSTDPGDLVMDITCGRGTTAYVAEQWGRRWITCDTSRISITLTRQRLITSIFDYYSLMHPDNGVSGGFVYDKIPHVTLESIANNEPANSEVLYDRPRVDKTKIRVTGPFTVEAIPSPVMLPIDSLENPVNQTRKQSDWRGELKATGIIMRGGQKIEFSRVEPLSGTRHLQAEAETKESTPRKAVVCFADETKPLDSRMVRMALDEAEKIRPSPKMIVFCAFQFDPAASKDIDEVNWPGITLIKAQMNTDLLTEDLKKNRSSNQSFWAVGQPDVVCKKLKDGSDAGKYVVEVRGYDYYDMKNGMQSGETSDIAMWMLDADYDGLSLNPAQIFFPMSGNKDDWSKLAKTLRAEIDQDLIETYRGTKSIPFDADKNTKIAVKIVDNRGVESLKVMDVEG